MDNNNESTEPKTNKEEEQLVHSPEDSDMQLNVKLPDQLQP